MKEPKIRFKGFSGEWEETTIGNTASLRAGKSFNFQRAFEHIYPCYGGNGIRNYVDDYSHEGNYPIIGRQGALCGNVALTKGKFYATEHAVVASPLKDNDAFFLYYCYTNANLNQYAKGCAQPGLSVGAINEVGIRLPNYKEQQSIASFFTTLDAQISACTSRLASLKQVKVASLQAMFPQEGETTPRVRFKGF
ncbi:MAG: restriction endonuclease subunit S, partial [Bacteroides sp.]